MGDHAMDDTPEGKKAVFRRLVELYALRELGGRHTKFKPLSALSRAFRVLGISARSNAVR